MSAFGESPFLDTIRLKSNKKDFRELDIKNNHMRDEDVGTLLTYMHDHHEKLPITRVSLESSSLSEAATNQLMEGLKILGVKQIHFNIRHIGDLFCKTLTHIITRGGRLSSIVINGDKMTAEGLTELAMALKDNKTCTELILPFNKLSLPSVLDAVTILALFCRNKSIIKFNDYQVALYQPKPSMLERAMHLFSGVSIPEPDKIREEIHPHTNDDIFYKPPKRALDSAKIALTQFLLFSLKLVSDKNKKKLTQSTFIETLSGKFKVLREELDTLVESEKNSHQYATANQEVVALQEMTGRTSTLDFETIIKKTLSYVPSLKELSLLTTKNAGLTVETLPFDKLAAKPKRP